MSVSEHLADVVPYQRVYQPGPNEACTFELRITRRHVSVTITEPGPAVVRVVGRGAPGDAIMVIERRVTVE